ncbi:ABC transporter substrate-binding protein [Humidisolicoccus flavus]|uniref:ABC transporter substrate-binding protein n=1 Tax=Humidisolicoccus flavus TaxID=3111414 RepID=UPI00324F1C88
MQLQRRSTLNTRGGRGKAIAGLALLSATALTLAGCSNDGGGGGGAETDSISVLIAAPQEGAGKILAEEYEEATGISVDVTVLPYDQIQSRVLLDVQSGTNQFDVIQYWYTSVGALAQGGALKDLTEWIEGNDEIDEDDFIDAIYDPYTLYEGNRYGLPIDGDTHVMFYNKTILERNGVAVPTTWEEYIAAAKTITENESANGVYGTAMLGDTSAFNIGSTFFNRLATMSPDPIDPVRPDLSSDAALAAAQSMLDLAPYALPSPLETGFDQALPQFLGGNIAMIEFWTDLGVYAQDPEGSEIVDEWGVAPLPIGPEGKISGAVNAGWAIGISPTASDEEKALDFLQFATSQEMNVQLSSTAGSGVDPIYTSTFSAPEYLEVVPEVAKVAEQVFPNVQPWPTSPQSPEMISSLNDNLALMLQGNLSPEEALAATDAAWDELGVGDN